MTPYTITYETAGRLTDYTFSEASIPASHAYCGGTITRWHYPRRGDNGWGDSVRWYPLDRGQHLPKTRRQAMQPDFSAHDQFGYAIGYYPGELARDRSGRPVGVDLGRYSLSAMDGDCLCAPCALAYWRRMDDDTGLYVALEINGDIQAEEHAPLCCDNCGEIIIEAWGDDPDTDDEDTAD